jgi:hypothetical protein
LKVFCSNLTLLCIRSELNQLAETIDLSQTGMAWQLTTSINRGPNLNHWPYLSVHAQRCSLLNESSRRAGLIPHDQPGGPLVANLAAFWQQISPIMPVLPTVPTHKSSAVYNLAFEAFHGMEEVIGSIPIRSTNSSFFAPSFLTFGLFRRMAIYFYM